MSSTAPKEWREHLERLRNDPALFVRSLTIKTGKGSAYFNEVMAPHQQEWLAVFAPMFLALARGETPSLRNVWCEATKGAGKDHLLSALVLWLCAFAEQPLFGQVAAADQDQGEELTRSAREWLYRNSWLMEDDRVKINAYKIIGSSGAEIHIITADPRGSHGARPKLLIVNEIHAIEGKGWEFVSNLLDNSTKVPDGCTIVATNAGHVDSPAWNFRRDVVFAFPDQWKILQFTEPAPWLDLKDLEQAKARNTPSRYDRLFRGIWAAGGGDAFDANDIRRATTLARPRLLPDGRPAPLVPEKGWVYLAAVDIGLRRDATAIVVLAKDVGYAETAIEEHQKQNRLWSAFSDDFEDEIQSWTEQPERRIIGGRPGTGKMRLIDVKIWKPEQCGGTVQVEEIEAALINLHGMLNLSAIGLDPYEARYLIERMQKTGMPAFGIDQQSSLPEMAQCTFDAFRDATIELYEHPELIADISNLRMVERSSGMRLVSPRSNIGNGTRHGDTASALQMCLMIAKRFWSAQSGKINRPLLCWP